CTCPHGQHRKVLFREDTLGTDGNVACRQGRQEHIFTNARLAQNARRPLAFAEVAEDTHGRALGLDVLAGEEALEGFDRPRC
ncbi:MAG: hypothetical protein ACK55Z_36285, partial [bacterium]